MNLSSCKTPAVGGGEPTAVCLLRQGISGGRAVGWLCHPPAWAPFKAGVLSEHLAKSMTSLGYQPP